MTKAFRMLGIHLLGLLLVASAGLTPAMADAKPVYATPPVELAAMTQDELNAFGMRLITEAYTIRQHVGSPDNQLGATQEQIDPATVQAVKDLYDEDALIQRARLNYGLTKKTYYPHDIDKFAVSDVVLTLSTDKILVVSFNVRLPNRTSLQSGIVMSGETMPRILVMRWNDGDSMWKIFTHADFDTPKSFLCGANPDFMPEKSQFRPEDIALAKETLEKMQAASLAGTEKSVQAKGFQYVLASGERKTAPGAVRAKMKAHVEPENVEAIRSGDLLAMRFDSKSTLTLDGGDVEHELRPRLMTFHKDSDGEWRMVAIGIFSVTEKLAKDVSCIAPTSE